jgi:diguanylate cyclase (GGDEF)-like protein/PAS domain S-box-containing protein
MKNTYEDKILNADIMLAGDSAEDHYMLVQILNDKGYKVRRETSADAALAAVKIKKPDLIILGVNFTGIDDYEVCRMLKSEPETSIIPVIFLIDSEDSRGKVAEYLADGVDFITKPFQAEDVLIRVFNSLEAYFLGRELAKNNQSLHEEIKSQREIGMSLEIERKRLTTLMHIVGDGIICTDDSGMITMMNDAAATLTGWLPDDAAGKPVDKVFKIINDATRELSGNIVKKVLETGKTSEFGNILLVSKDGKVRHIEAVVLPVIQIKRKMEGTILIFGDYTEGRNNTKLINPASGQNQMDGQYNRRNFDSEMKKLEDDLFLPFAFVMADVKGLSMTNKTYGYKFGEILLKKVVNVFRSECRPDDIVVRVGEEKFVILMSVYDAKNADILVSRLNKAISEEKIGNIVFSLSIGESVRSGIYDEMDALLKKAEDEVSAEGISESSSFKNRIIFMIMNRLFEINELEKSHSQRISHHCAAIAKKMNFSEYEVKQIKLTGLVHDIGKIGIDESVITSRGTLTNEDWKAVQRNPEIGYRILITSNEFSEIAEFVLEHHERWDGKGYPRALSGEEISLQARIIAVADTYDSLISKRLYKKELREEEAINELKRCAGTQFDPEVVRVFVEEVLGKS